MSRRRRHRTSRQSSPPSLQTCEGAASTAAEAILRDADLRSAPQDEGDATPSAFALRATADKPQDAGRSVLIRAAESEDDAVAIHRLMLANAVTEMAEAAVDPVLYMETIWDTVRHGAALMAIVDGRLVGYLGLWKSRYDYSPESFLHDRGFYVLPDHRGGAAGAALLREAKAIAQEAGMTLKIIDTNPGKPRRAQRMSVTAQIIGFRPAGRVFTAYVRT
jgi:GNAT superfamily N-acetyltransferase